MPMKWDTQTHTMELLSDHFTKRNNIEWSFWPFFEATSRMNDLVSLVFKRLTISLQTKRFFKRFRVDRGHFFGNFGPFSYILWRTVFYTWFWMFTYFSTFFWFQSAPGVPRQTHFISVFFRKIWATGHFIVKFEIEPNIFFKLRNILVSNPNSRILANRNLIKKRSISQSKRSRWWENIQIVRYLIRFQFLKTTFSEVLRASSSEIPRFMEWGSKLRGPNCSKSLWLLIFRNIYSALLNLK